MRAFAGDGGVFSVEHGEAAGSERQMRARIGRGEQHRHLGIFDHQREAVLGIGGIEGNVGSAGFQDSEQADDESFRAAHGDADQRVGLDAEALQMAGKAIGALVELGDR